jgi:DNA-binding GntR family transcriptional regulator
MMTQHHSLLEARRVIQMIVASRHDRPSLVSTIASEIGADIVEGIIKPGQDLNTVELSKLHQSSRTPVREALMLLEAEGLVNIPPRKRPHAKILTIEEIREIYRTRAALLEFIATDVANLADEKDIEVLKVLLDKMRLAVKQRDARASVWLSVEFHDINTSIARNNTVKRFIDSLLLRTLPIRRLSLSLPTRVEESLDDHIRLVGAYENRDPFLASAILRANHVASLAAVENYFKQTGKLTTAE